MKQKLLLALTLLMSISVLAQEKKEEKSITLYGFIRNAYYVDTYRGVDAVADQFYLLPLYGGVDTDGNEINKDLQSNLSAIASRIGTKISGPELLGAKSSALMEFDFGGLTNSYPSVFRIRHAYMKLNWEKSALTVGQTWHPFWGDGAFPHVGNLNTGAPFQPFNRSPQLRLDYKLSENISLLGAAVYENQYSSKSFYDIKDDIDKTKAIRYGGMPELVAMVKFKEGNFNGGIGVELKSIVPIDIVNPTDSTSYKTSNTNTSLGFTAYGNYKNDKLYVLVKGTYGQNMTHLILPGGYGVKSVNAKGEYEYTNYNNYTAFANITYGKKVMAGLMLGVGGNLGTTDPLAGNLNYTNSKGKEVTNSHRTVGLFQSIQGMSRVAPSITFNVKNLRFTTEYEMTTATYGKGNFDLSNGLHDDSFSITNNRLLLMMMYFF